MRRALARLDPGAALAIFRTASGLSQQDVADIMGWSQSTVSLIEKGQRDTLFDLRELVRFADMVEMPRAALAPVLAGEPDATFDIDGLDELVGGVEEDVDRRSFGGFAAGAAAAFMLPDDTVPPRVTAAHVRYLRSCADSLWQRDQAVGGAAILKQALRHWRRARRMLDESDYPEAVGRDLLGTTSSLAVCVGWLAFDAGDLALAHRMYSKALPLAGSANDSVLTVHVLHNLSMLSSYMARTRGSRGLARDALRFADQAAHAARHESMSRLQALIALRRAGTVSGAVACALAHGSAQSDAQVPVPPSRNRGTTMADEWPLRTRSNSARCRVRSPARGCTRGWCWPNGALPMWQIRSSCWSVSW